MDTSQGLSDILSSLMQNPDVMRAVSSIAREASAGSPEAPKKDEQESSAHSPLSSDTASQLSQMIASLSNKSDPLKDSDESEVRSPVPLRSDGQRKELLRALKPFLSEKRCAVIDGILQFEGLAGVLSAFQSK